MISSSFLLISKKGGKGYKKQRSKAPHCHAYSHDKLSLHKVTPWLVYKLASMHSLLELHPLCTQHPQKPAASKKKNSFQSVLYFKFSSPNAKELEILGGRAELLIQNSH
jgi:hypothetical protein